MASDILELLADTLDGVYAVDVNQRIVLWNAAAERILGYRAEDALGKRCYQVLAGLSVDATPRCAPNCAAILWARAGRVFPSQNILTRTKAGQQKWISVTHVLLPEDKRESSTLVHIFHDITEQAEATAVLQRIGSIIAAAPPVRVPTELKSDEENDVLNSLTAREREVLRLLARGLGTKGIAEELVVGTATVRNHIQRILSKLGAHNRLEAVVVASHRGLL